jgi:hypothetical protein
MVKDSLCPFYYPINEMFIITIKLTMLFITLNKGKRATKNIK